jgi:hypothetical protein
MVRVSSLLTIALLLLCLAPAPSRAQLALDSTRAADAVIPIPDSPQVTLSGWADRRRTDLLDRRFAFGDLTYDRGVFRHITPPMDREYALDMTTYRFSPLESVPWARMNSGLRLRTGSIVRAEWAFVTDIKHTAALAPNHTLRVDARLRQDATAQRSLVEFSYDWRVAGRHHVGVRHTISQYKPDFDASAYYQYGTARTGRARAELTVLDAYHDLIFRTLGVSEKDEEFVRSYRQHPFLGQITLQTPARYPLRAELHVGWQPTSELLVQSQLEPDHRYRDREAAHYVGALVEYSTGPVTGGLIVQRDKSTLDRLGLRPGVPSDYRAAQRFQRGGAFLLGSWGPFQGEAWFFLEDYYDRNRGEDFALSAIGRAMNYTEYRKNYRVRLAYVPSPGGWYGSLEYLALSRRMGPQPWIMGNEWTNHWYSLAPSNYRLSGVVGYRFDRGAVELGINYDLDGDQHYKAGPDYQKKRFDNGFIRFVVGW